MFDTWVLRRPTFFILPSIVIIVALLMSASSPALSPLSLPQILTKLKTFLPVSYFNTASTAPISTLTTTTSTASSISSTTTSQPPKMPKAPVYFFSHGGPDVQYNTTHPVYPVLQSIGREITQKVKPSAVVVFSAHWQPENVGPDEIHVNNAEKTDLIYDFYGFPPHFYKATFPSVGSPSLASHIISLLSSAGIRAKGLTRGLDHGVFSGFNVAFPPAKNPLEVPLVQVSLFNSENPLSHFKLGEAVQSLREQNIAIICTGMTVHNLRDMRFAFGRSEPMPYSVSFDNAVKEAVEQPDPEKRKEEMVKVLKRADAREAHPWMDHLMPLYIAAGAAGADMGKQTWTMHEASFAWAQYRFGELPEEGK
ncbi:Extradiol ring-cleavage dioxygenase, class III enzyme, subunit B [Triangularia verruculosa]|uniref:Extradiol ring-cleavage dioxygenase, class III enzyme, subunit B n=1 Tax=Triangularia verruculosa TaxID=2587418 RepID=A0AAN6XFE0_9PEZI|nr:Extradiol ring-cleavage dioxygenase, class III enzyme, subunit B [Triangularia verruculosa]